MRRLGNESFFSAPQLKRDSLGGTQPHGYFLESFGAQNESKRARVSALGAQLEASERAGILAWDTEVEREVRVLMPLLAAYLESLEVGGAA